MFFIPTLLYNSGLFALSYEWLKFGKVASRLYTVNLRMFTLLRPLIISSFDIFTLFLRSDFSSLWILSRHPPKSLVFHFFPLAICIIRLSEHIDDFRFCYFFLPPRLFKYWVLFPQASKMYQHFLRFTRSFFFSICGINYFNLAIWKIPFQEILPKSQMKR